MSRFRPVPPNSFLKVRVECLQIEPSLLGWCVGYEFDEWRGKQLANHLLDWLPEFALKYSEWDGMNSGNARELLGRAAASVYKSDKYKKRGEFGEILLHAMIRQHFRSAPAISKYYYKDSSNDTVKGFDAVHVVGEPGDWELWLGEVKFYKDISKAIADVVEELQEHTGRDYLRSEFIAITNKIDDSWGEAAELRKLLSPNTSLDEIFTKVCVPVLLTYDSTVVASHTIISEEYEAAFRKEVLRHRDTFASKELPTTLEIRLFLLPIKSKEELVKQMDEALKACQAAYST